ncbi:MAG: hypothetical protein GPJ54_01125 [Candidatus Heimdallarchaeota archaeon]|nr:hypothetical protein [Candidatus Heimdallarchaeota archaeon]
MATSISARNIIAKNPKIDLTVNLVTFQAAIKLDFCDLIKEELNLNWFIDAIFNTD